MCTLVEHRPGLRLKYQMWAIGCGFHEAVRGCALASHGDKRMAKLRIITPILLPAGMPVLGTHSEYQDLMRMQSRTPQFLKRTGRIKLRESTLCGWYGASIPVCHVVPICTCAMAKCWRPGIHLCLAIRSGQRPRTTFHRQER